MPKTKKEDQIQLITEDKNESLLQNLEQKAIDEKSKQWAKELKKSNKKDNKQKNNFCLIF